MSPSAIHCGQNWGPWGWVHKLLAKWTILQIKLDLMQLVAVCTLSDAINYSAPAPLHLKWIISAKRTRAWLSESYRFSDLQILLSDNTLALSQILCKKKNIEFWIWLSVGRWAGKLEKPSVSPSRLANLIAKQKERNVLSGCNVSYTHFPKICALSVPSHFHKLFFHLLHT